MTIPWEVPAQYGDPSSSLSRVILTSVTLKVGQGDPHTIPNRFSMRGTYTPNLVILAHSILKLLWYQDLNRSIGTDGQTTLWWQFHECTWTPNLVILTHLLKFSRLRRLYDDIHKVDLCDLESGSRWPIYNHKQVFHERYVHTKLGDPGSVISFSSYRGNMFTWWNSRTWLLWPWNWVKVTHV